MLSKEAYYENCLRNRKLAADPEVTRCVCPNTLCEWHGSCRECVGLHRHYGDHIPCCLQPIIKRHIDALANTVEARTVQKEATPAEYRQYVIERGKPGCHG